MVAQDHITVDEWTQAEPQAAEGTEAPGRVGIVGLGLIGGSLARRLATTHCEVLAWNHRAEPYVDAQRYGIRCMEHLEDLVLAKPDVLVLCNPLSAMPDILHRIAPVIDPDATTLTDVGSVKGLVRDQVNEAGLDHCYVGAHPMAGNELSGWRAADPQLFDKALWAVTFGDNTAYGRVLQVASMITQLCMNRLIIVDDATHDRAAAQISHMPHAIATMLANMLIDNPDRNIAMSLAAGSWRDMTRVALTDPHRTQAMVEENSGDVEQLLREVIRRVTRLADALRDNDQQTVDNFFAHADPFRSARAKALAAIEERHTETIFGSLEVRADHWREDLLASAARGEHIIRFTDPHRAIMEQGIAL